ncbi:hypothetical protein K458DRAFT_151450 [Lentithecium fluviatile CBS 122367]|uniref:Uncharacterized protein n=1 Tax=Lentithecium fluviatile CBS 122367 TaxID=1168545 RepID=A0A6G1JEP7_9PLEO|nr:hypothetical protein K458DRAFT_151450 [Lentithecium fluviatile CBS 122367]
MYNHPTMAFSGIFITQKFLDTRSCSSIRGIDTPCFPIGMVLSILRWRSDPPARLAFPWSRAFTSSSGIGTVVVLSSRRLVRGSEGNWYDGLDRAGLTVAVLAAGCAVRGRCIRRSAVVICISQPIFQRLWSGSPREAYNLDCMAHIDWFLAEKSINREVQSEQAPGTVKRCQDAGFIRAC